MKQLSSLRFISACLLAISVATIPVTLPASAQVTTQRTDTQRTYENTNREDDRGLWGLAGLVGLFGLLGSKRRHDDDRSVTRDDKTLYDNPTRR